MSVTARAVVAARRAAPPRLRHALLIAHRWIGLATAAFLIVVGATGSLIAFNDELEAWISPELFLASPPRAGAPLLDPLDLREQLLADRPGVAIDWVELTPQVDRSLVFGLEPAPGATAPLPEDQVFVDPYTGRVVGERAKGDLGQGWKNVMPFVNTLHTSLALGDVGTWVLGVVALLWTVDCFVGLYLTLPARRATARTGVAPGRASPAFEIRRASRWHSRWSPAWKVRWRAGASRLYFDLHRAGGLWTWGMLLLLAWSGVGFNLGAVYRPVMQALAGYVDPGNADAGTRARSTGAVPIGWGRAREQARKAMADAAARNAFTVRRERLLHHDTARGWYEYRVLSTLDVGDRMGNTMLFLDDRTGAVLRTELPTGLRAGNTLDTWLSSLHTAAWGGVAMQVAVCGTGCVLVVLCGTGVWLWWRRRRARRIGRQARSAMAASGMSTGIDVRFLSEPP